MSLIKILRNSVRKELVRRNEIRKWQTRIDDAVSCPDNVLLPRVKSAGKCIGEFQVMHNGLKVLRDGYYGPGMTELLIQNKGCHEPQEEVVFSRLLSTLPTKSTMIELGAYWGFYSMWFVSAIAEAKAYVLEPDQKNLEVCRRNFRENNLAAEFSNRSIGQFDPDVSVVTVDDLMAEHALASVQVLHADIQGAELEMLEGSANSLANGMIDNMFISTHSEELHQNCIKKLKQHDFDILIDIKPAQSFSVDGLILSRRRDLPPLILPECSLKLSPIPS